MSFQTRNADGTVSYPPYRKFSPFFIRGSDVNPTNDNVWNRDRAGSCLEDVFLQFKTNGKYEYKDGIIGTPISWVLGTVKNDGIRTVNMKIMNEEYARAHYHIGHRDIHPDPKTGRSTQFIDDKGVYRISRLGNTIGHYTNGAVFCLGEVKDIEYKRPDTTNKKVHIITIKEQKFSPNEITIEQGEIVEWVNQEDVTSHTVFSGSWSNVDDIGEKTKSPIIKARGGRYALEFNEVGEFHFVSVTYEPLACKVKVMPKSVTPTSETDSLNIWYKYKEIFRRFKWSREKILAWIRARGK